MEKKQEKQEGVGAGLALSWSDMLCWNCCVGQHTWRASQQMSPSLSLYLPFQSDTPGGLWSSSDLLRVAPFVMSRNSACTRYPVYMVLVNLKHKWNGAFGNIFPILVWGFPLLPFLPRYSSPDLYCTYRVNWQEQARNARRMEEPAYVDCTGYAYTRYMSVLLNNAMWMHQEQGLSEKDAVLVSFLPWH